jgi:hypothetical protein
LQTLKCRNLSSNIFYINKIVLFAGTYIYGSMIIKMQFCAVIFTLKNKILSSPRILMKKIHRRRNVSNKKPNEE